jgi:hypothetical protein
MFFQLDITQYNGFSAIFQFSSSICVTSKIPSTPNGSKFRCPSSVDQFIFIYPNIRPRSSIRDLLILYLASYLQYIYCLSSCAIRANRNQPT